MSKIKKIVACAGVAMFAIGALLFGMYGVAVDSIQFDLKIIGESKTGVAHEVLFRRSATPS